MSLTKRLIVITNTYEDLIHADSIESSVEEIASIIKRGLDDTLLKMINSKEKFNLEEW